MSIIPNNFVNDVVAIGIERQSNGYLEKLRIGSGFLVYIQEPNNIQTLTIYKLKTVD